MDDPIAAGGLVETNPFSLFISPQVSGTSYSNDEGYIYVSPAFVVKTPDTGRDLAIAAVLGICREWR